MPPDQAGVQQTAQQLAQLGNAPIRCDIQGCDRGNLQRLAEDAPAGKQEVAQHLRRAVLGRRGLPHPIVTTHDAGEPAQFLE